MKFGNSVHSFLKISCFIILTSLLTSCISSKKVNTDYLYFQNGPGTVAVQQNETVIQPNDMLSILVYSKTPNQDQVKLFNIPAEGGGPLQGYQVSPAGTINFPVIGTIRVAGLSKNELQFLLVQKLVDFVKNPTVIVKFLQFNINMLGEVRSPGTLKLSQDKVTIIDAISNAGDLTDFARRDDIVVIREENGKKMFHHVDLRDKSVFESPVYILQPNDIVYVRPTNNKLKTMDVDQDAQRRFNQVLSVSGFAIGIIGFLISILRIR